MHTVFSAKKIILLGFALLFCAPLFAQRRRRSVVNDPMYDLQKAHFGFSIFFNQAKMKFEASDYFHQSDTLQYINTINHPGFGIGGVINFRLANYLDLRMQANIQFAQRDLEFEFKPDSAIQNNVKKVSMSSTYFEFPILLKYKSARHHNTRFYVIGGVSYRYDFSSDIDTERSNSKPVVALNPSTFSYELGLGFDFYFEYFKLSPEFKVVNSINNALVQDRFIYASSLSALYPQLIQFSFIFE